MAYDYKFPVKSATACQYKWTWSTLFLSTGTSSSCHRCRGWDVSKDIKNFHNHEGKLNDRKKMTEGQWPGNGCEYCKKIEVAGGTSERTGYINDLDYTPPELIEDPAALKVTPRILEVYFTNVCNQKCAYCSPFFSSLIQAEIKKHGPLEEEYDLGGFISKPGYEERKAQFWEWMEEKSQHLYDFQILGGEPMYQPEFEECLSFFERKVHPNLNWKIFSNLKHDSKKFEAKIKRISQLIEDGKLGSFEVVCSVDNWGPQAEFARYGMELDEWETNFNTILYDKHVRISIHSTISVVTLCTMSDLYSKIHEWGKHKRIFFGWNTVANPTFMSPEILGHHATKYFDELIDLVKTLPYSKEEQYGYLNGFRQQVSSHPVDPIRLKKLNNYLDRLDTRRGTDWRKIYPWLHEIIEKETEGVEVNTDFTSVKPTNWQFIDQDPEASVEAVVGNFRDKSDKVDEN